MDADRIKEIQEQTAYPESVSVQQALLKVWNETEQEQLRIAAVSSRAFEYRVIDHDMFDEDEIQTINSMGSKGWEIIRILEPMKWLNSDGMFVRIYYKREKQS